MNLFLEVAKKHNEIANKIDLTFCDEPTSVLESKLVTANKFSQRTELELINYVETLKEESKVDELVSLLEDMYNHYGFNSSSMMSVLKSIPAYLLLTDEMKEFALSGSDSSRRDNFYHLITNNTGYTIYDSQRNPTNFYKTDIQLIFAKAFYYLYLREVNVLKYSSLITPHKIKEDSDYEKMFSYYKHFFEILNGYLNTQFELTTEDIDKVLSDKINNVKELTNINKSLSLEDLSLVYKKLDELNVHFDLVSKLVNQYLYAKKLGNHDLFVETIESNIKLINDYDGSYDDYLMTYELLKSKVDLNEVDINRYQELRNHFMEKNIYNHLYKDKFIYYLSNDEEIQLNISEQMNQLNKILKYLKEKELNEENKAVKTKINNIILMLSNLTLKKSKVFLHLLSERIESFTNYNCILFKQFVFENLQLNMLNEKTMDLYLSTVIYLDDNAIDSMNFETKMTPEFLYEVIQSEFKYKLSNLLVEKGIKNDIIIRILKSFTIVLEGSTVIKEDDYLKLISEMSVKEINELYKATTDKKEISKENVFSLYLLEKMHKIFKQVENDNQLRFILRNDDNIQENLNDMLEKELSSKKEYKTFQSKLDASDAFFEKHKSSLLNFFYDDKHRLALTYAKENSPQQVDNVFLLAKADIAGMLHTVKFSKIEQELEMALPEESKKTWKKQLSLEFNRFTVKEVVDFRTLMELGENPTRSCMNYATGQYRRCLLSIFDSTKQYVGVYDNGKLVARAILRLTKTTKTQKGSVLGFEDVEKLTQEVTFEDKSKNEESVLFLERMYTNYDSNQRIQMQNQIIKLVKKKAEEMGVKAIAASDYIQSDICKSGNETMKIFITHSQNGNQYLDSFGGQATENSGGIYKTTSSYGIIHEV